MPETLDNQVFRSLSEVADRLGVTRQTLWRWRKAGYIPMGWRFRDGRVLFSEQDIVSIEEYAQRLEPIASKDPRQLRLFGRASGVGG